MTGPEVRQSFLDYFARHGHTSCRRRRSSRPTIPTLLFTNAGMNQFKDLFLGKERRDYRRAVTVQKCMRVSGKHNDLDNVGPSLRHHTFFEMLGNFSFGDYFKHEAIPFAWELLTKVWQLPPDRLFPTIFKGEGGIPRDDEAFAIWKPLVPASRITELGLVRELLADGRHRPVRPLLRDSLLPGRRDPLPGAGLPRHRVQLRALRRGLEQRVHGVRPQRRRHAHAAAGAVDRHRHGPRARDVGHPGQALELRHRSVHADPRDDRQRCRPRVHGRARPGRSSRTSRCA